MRKIDYGINSYYKKASVYFDYGPFWTFWLDWLINWICFLIPPIPFPPIKIKLSDEDSIKWNEGKEWVNMKEWYGDFAAWFCVIIHTSISDFCWQRQTHTIIDVDYDKLKKATYDYDKKNWVHDLEIAKELDDEEN